MNKFPWRKYTNLELSDEYYKLRKKVNEPITFPIQRSIIGYSCTNNFFQKERLATPGMSNKLKSCLDYWNSSKDRAKIIDSYKKSNKDLFGTAVFISHAPAQFSLVAAAKLYKYFYATKVFDPYAGWGDRCLAAMACDIDYVGVDSNPKLFTPFKKMINFYESEGRVEFISDKSENVYKKIDYDLLFTSPPYWQNGKMIECYNKCTDNYEDFLEKSLYPIMEDALNKNVWVCLHLPQNMYNDIKKEFGSADKIISLNKNTFPDSKNKTEKIYCW